MGYFRLFCHFAICFSLGLSGLFAISAFLPFRPFGIFGLFWPQQRQKGRGNLNPISSEGKQEAAAEAEDEAEAEADVLEPSRKLLSRSLGHRGKEEHRGGVGGVSVRGRYRERRQNIFSNDI